MEKIASLRTERRKLASLNEHERNPREHPEEGSWKWKALSESLRESYFEALVLNIRNGKLVSGAFRKKVMIADGFTDADVVIVDLDEQTHYARMIMANRHFGEWQEEILAALARDIEKAGIHPGLAGMDEKELAELLEGPTLAAAPISPETLVTSADELQAQWRVQLGDLFQVGRHRVLCGSCTEAESWHRLLVGIAADMVWTDTPYNVKNAASNDLDTDLEGSANLRSSDNLEQMLLVNDPATHDFHAAWIDELAARADG